MEDPTISVIIPTWNNQDTILIAIQGCLDQMIVPLEILVCDDGSTDNTKAVVEKLNDTRVRWLPGKHTGLPAVARNRGMSVARGAWLAFCDSDDQWLPEKLARQFSEMKLQGTLASATKALIKRDGRVTSESVSQWKGKRVTFSNLLNSNAIVCSSVVLSTSIFKKIDGFPENHEFKSFEDYVYWLRVSTKTNFAFINEPLVIYDDHPLTSIRKEHLSDRIIQKKVFNETVTWLGANMTASSIFCITRIRSRQLKIFLRTLLKAILHEHHE